MRNSNERSADRIDSYRDIHRHCIFEECAEFRPVPSTAILFPWCTVRHWLVTYERADVRLRLFPPEVYDIILMVAPGGVHDGVAKWRICARAHGSIRIMHEQSLFVFAEITRRSLEMHVFESKRYFYIYLYAHGLKIELFWKILLHFTSLYFVVLRCTSPYFTVLHRTSPYFIVLQNSDWSTWSRAYSPLSESNAT